jgi:iron(III) transport system substrate-binding protein
MLISGCKSPASNSEQQSSDAPAGEITVYTHRHYETDQQLFKRFEDSTGIEVNVVNASADELIQRMSREGEHSPADVLITVDAGRLVKAKEKGLLQSVNLNIPDSIIPSSLKDPDNQWFGLTKRARIMVYSKERVNPEELSTYEALTRAKWNDRILIRSSSNIYNQSLLASMIAHDGENKAKEWAKGMVENFARKPKGNDRDQVKAIMAGEGDIAIINTYYLGKLLNSENPEEVKAAQQVGLFFPNQEGRGTHVNVSGAGIARYAPNKDNAQLFLEFMASKEIQEVFASANYEYPVNPNADLSDLLQSWGDFKEDTLQLSKLGKLNQQAVIIFDEVGWK